MEEEGHRRIRSSSSGICTAPPDDTQSRSDTAYAAPMWGPWRWRFPRKRTWSRSHRREAVDDVSFDSSSVNTPTGLSPATVQAMTQYTRTPFVVAGRVFSWISGILPSCLIFFRSRCDFGLILL